MEDLHTDNAVLLPPEAQAAAQEITEVSARAWSKDLLAGFSGNVSRLLPKPVQGCRAVVITCSGSAKGCLAPGDFTVLDLANGRVLAGGKPSSEAAVHLEIYRNCPESTCVIHTHPPHMLALSLAVPPEMRLALPLIEARIYSKLLGHTPAEEPGTATLGRVVGEKARAFQAVWMEDHGLVVHGRELFRCLGITEELEQIARIQLLTMSAKGIS